MVMAMGISEATPDAFACPLAVEIVYLDNLASLRMSDRNHHRRRLDECGSRVATSSAFLKP